MRFVGVLLGLSCAACVTSSVLLVVQHRRLEEQARAIVALQTEYKNYVVSVRRLLRGSTLAKERQVRDGTDEKKNSSRERNIALVNRCAAYVRKSSLAYYKQHKMAAELKRIAPHEWLSYTSKILAEQASKADAGRAKVRRRKNKHKRRRRVFTVCRRHPVNHGMRTTVGSAKPFSWPLDPSRFWLSSLFGPRKNPRGWKFHRGLDMASVRGTPVKAAAAGFVVEARHDARGYGKMVLVDHGNGYQTRYAHLDKILVSLGQHVERGFVIGRVGATGAVRSKSYDGSHLHFEVCQAGRAINPLPLLAHEAR